MKRNVVLLILVCLSLVFFAETMTHMMLVNGRRWNYREFYLSQNGSSPNDSTYPMDTVYRNIIIDGPYEFDGKQCMTRD